MNVLFSRIRSIFQTSAGKQGVQIVQNGVLIAFVFFQVAGAFSAMGSYVQNDNSGYFYVDFNNDQQGIVSDGAPWRQDVAVDTIVGTVGIESGKTSGYFTTANIRPSSFTKWDKINLTANYSAASDVVVSLYECNSTPTPITGFQNLTLSGGMYDISSLSPTTYPCVALRVDMTSGAVPPTIDSIRVSWNPLPAYLLTLSVPDTVPAGGVIDANVNYSVSYVNDTNTVVWTTIPNVTPGTYNTLYNQNPALTFVSATNGGQYTNSSITINGITVPAKSIYWDLGNINAGQSGTLNFRLQTTSGWQNGMQFGMNGSIDSLKGNLYTGDADGSTVGTQTFNTTITSAPQGALSKSVSGTARIGNIDYVVNSGTYTPLITYNVTLANTFSAIGGETIFNPIITDDLSDITSKLSSICSVGVPASRITPLGGGTLSGNTITWDTASGDLTNVAPGSAVTVSYTVDYSGCPDGTEEYNNSASSFADNISTVTATHPVVVGVDTTPRGSFAKGDKINGSSEITGGMDDHKTTPQTYGDSFAYQLQMNNIGMVAGGDYVATDRISDDLTFMTATVPPDANGTLYYNTSTNGATPVYTVTPGVGIVGSGWTTVMPAPSTVRWVAVYVPCLNSPFFPAPPGNAICNNAPTSVITDIQVSINAVGNVCLDTEITNSADFTINRASTNVANTSLSALPSPLRTSDTELTHATPSLASFGGNSNITGTTTASVGQTVTYTISVANTGVDTAHNTTVSIPTPQINVNGVPTYLSFVQATGGTVNTTGLPATVTVGAGTMPAGTTKSVTIKYSIPSGVKNNDNFTLVANISATDDNNCRPIASSVSHSTTVSSRPQLQTFKNAEESVVSGGQDIHYDITYRNTGNAPTQGTYVVDRIPAKSVFKEAYTSGTNSNTVAFSCAGCKVYFSSSTSLPPTLNVSQPLNGAMINSYFSLGAETTPGLWAPVGMTPNQVRWVAWLLDDTTTTNILPTGAVGKVGLTITNDDDTTTGTIEDSPIGTIVSNAPGIFSTDLIQAIDNQVFTTILPDPGLRITKSSDKDMVYAGESFNWNIDYYNDSGNPDTSVVMTDTMPAGTTVTGVFHTWNAKAVSDGASPSTEVDITADSDVTVTPNGDGTTTVTINVTGLRGGSLLNIEGGNIRIATDTLGTLTTGQVITNVVQGCFANPSGSYCISAQDDVAVANPDLWIRKQVDITDPLAGETVNYTLIVSNESDHDAPNVLISDTLPAGLCYNGPTQITTSGWSIGSPTITGGSCDTSSTTLTWSIPNANNISNPTFTPAGTIPAHSGDIYIRYAVAVHGSVLPGTLLTNGAHIETNLTEDPIYPNDTSEDVTTPLPDPYVIKTSQLMVDPGANSTYTISYGNNTREVAKDVYIIDTFPISNYPNYASNTDTDMKFISASGARGETFYYHDGPLATPAPTFNPASPLVGGWTASPTANTAFMAVVIPGDLAGQSGPYQIQITFQAVDPVTLANLPAGLSLTNKSEIFSSTTDGNLTNNLSTAATNTPGLDLTITKKGSSEGGFPGVAPGGSMVYDITIKNQGTVDACAVYVLDVLSTDITLVAPIHNFNTLQLVDGIGQPVLPHDLTANNISTAVGITYDPLAHKWYLGSTSTTPYANVCMPPGSQQTFQVYGQINANVADSTVVANAAIVGEDSPANEDVTSNNIDTTSVSVYQADLLIEKSGFSYGPDNTPGTSDDTLTTANKGETIEYKLSYDNIGNINAENPVITETIPQGTCLYSEITPPAGSTLEYSQDNGLSWIDSTSYTFSAYPDCSLTNFRVLFAGGLPAPSHFDGENDLAEFTGAFTNTEAINNAAGDVIQLSSSGLPSVYLQGAKPKQADLNGDGLLDLVFPESIPGEKLSIYKNQSTPGSVSFRLAGQIQGPAWSASYPKEDFEITDINNDSLPDIVVATTELMVYRNTSAGGNITFVLDQSETLFANSSSQFYVSSAIMKYPSSYNANGIPTYTNLDINADGKQDLLVSGANQPASSVGDAKACLNTTPSTPGATLSFDCNTGVTSGPEGGLGNDMGKSYNALIVVADFNNDGLPDEIGGQSLGNTIRINRNTSSGGTASFAYEGSMPVVAVGYRGYAFDADGDGYKDLLMSSPMRVLRNTTSSTGGPISFAITGSILNALGGHSTPADLNGDGKLDMVVTADNSGYGNQFVVLNTSTPGTVDFSTYNNTFPMVGPKAGAAPAVADFNADGAMDIVISGYVSTPGNVGNTKVYRNTMADTGGVSFTVDPGADLFGPMLFGASGGAPFTQVLGHEPQIADFDLDGKLDILVIGGSGTAPSIFHNESTNGGALVFSSYSSFATHPGQMVLGLIDNFDNDVNGLKDIIVSDYTTSAEAYTNASTPGAVTFNESATNFAPTGTYETVITSTSLTSWDKLQVIQDLPAGTDIKYSIYDPTFAIQLLPPQSATNGYIDISGLSSGYTTLGLHVDFSTSDTSVTPTLDAWRATYRTFDRSSFTFLVLVSSNATVSVIHNTAAISTITPEITLVNNTATYDIALNAADVAITKDVNFAAAQSGDNITYTINYINNGPQTATNVEIFDIWPQGMLDDPPVSITSPNTSGGDAVSCVPPNFLPPDYATSYGIYCGALTLSPGESGTITIVARVSDSLANGTLIQNNTYVTSGTLDTDPTNNQDTVTTIIGNFANVYTQKSGPTSTNINSDITYTIDYGNNGNIPATNVVLVDTLDTNVTFVSATQTAGSPTITCANVPAANKVTCNVDGGAASPGVTLAAGATGRITIRVHVNNDNNLIINNEIINNTIAISTSTTETSIVDNIDTFDVPVLPIGASVISGNVFYDGNANVQKEILDLPISGAQIYLSGVDLYGNVLGPDKTLYPSMYTTLMTELAASTLIPAGSYLASAPYPANYVVIAPKTTSILGTYNFGGLSAGTYTVTENQPNGYLSTGSNAGYMNTDILGAPIYSASTDGLGSIETGLVGDVNHIYSIVLGDNQNARNYDFGETNGTIGDLVFLDNGGTPGVFDSTDVGIGNVTIALYTDTNSNGLVDSGEPVRTTTTLSDGSYLFTNLALNTSYIVKVTDTNNVVGTYNAIFGTAGQNNNGQNPAGYVVNLSSLTPTNATADFAYGSVSNGTGGGTGGGSNGSSCTTDCNPQTCNTTGICGTIGNFVFWDKNQNGIKDGDDVGVFGMAITMYTDLNKNGNIDPGEPSQTRNTNINGEYYFTLFTPSDLDKQYIIKITDVAIIAQFNFLPSIAPGAGNLDNYSKDPAGYIALINPSQTSDLAADFGFKTDQILPPTGQTHHLYSIIFTSIGVLGLFLLLRKFKVIKINEKANKNNTI